MKIPKIYEKVIERMYVKSFEGKLETWKVRQVLGVDFKIRRREMMPILREMHDLKLIKIPPNAGGRFVFVIWTPPKEEE